MLTQPPMWRRAEAVLFRQAMDDVVLLVPGPDPEPFALAGGAALWRLLDRPCTTGQLLSTLSPGTAVSASADSELDGLLIRLAEIGAVERISS